MKFLLPSDLQKFRYYTELLSEIHGRVEIKRLSYTKKWVTKNKLKVKKQLKDIEE